MALEFTFSGLFHHAYGTHFDGATMEPQWTAAPAQYGWCWICGRRTTVYQAGKATQPKSTFTDALAIPAAPVALCRPCWFLNAMNQRYYKSKDRVSGPFRWGWSPPSLHAMEGHVLCPISAVSFQYVLTANGFVSLPTTDLTGFLFEGLAPPFQVSTAPPNSNASWARVLHGFLFLGGAALPVFLGTTHRVVVVERDHLAHAEVICPADLPENERKSLIKKRWGSTDLATALNGLLALRGAAQGLSKEVLS